MCPPAPARAYARKKKSKSWKEWSEKYEIFDPSSETDPYFYTRLGPKQVEPYPKQIQDKLQEAMERCKDESVSQTIEYDMTGGWKFKLRIFCEDEKTLWEDQLRQHTKESDGVLVGAQWDIEPATIEPPPFETDVTYRPIFLSEAA